MSVARPLFLKGMNLLGIAGLAAACASPAEPSKNIQPTSISTPIPQGISCDPEKFAKEHNVIRVHIGGDESDNPQQTEYIRRLREIYGKIDQCTPLSKEDLAFAQNIDPKPKGTVAPAKATATPENENKVAPVEIFPKEMDPYIEIVDYLNPKNDRVLIVGIKGLPKGMTEVPVSAPIGGKLRNATNDPNWAAVGNLNDPTLTSFAFTNFKTVQDKSVQPENNIGTLTDKGLKIKLGNKEYIATVDVYTKNPLTNKTDWEKANEIVRQFFPRAPIVTAEYNPATASSSTTPAIKYTVTFEDEKPAGLK